MGTLWAQLGSIMGSLMFLSAMLKSFPPFSLISDYLRVYTNRLTSRLSPYVRISISEYSGDREAFSAIQTYLSDNSSRRANRLKGNFLRNTQNPLVLTMDDNEEISDDFHGINIWWVSEVKSYEMFLNLTFPKRHRDLITSQYLNHVIEEGKAIAARNRKIRLYTNLPGRGSNLLTSTEWRDVLFEHPASFDTLALHPEKKEDIVKDLVKFKNGKDYYAKMGKPWKRGYLLYGPPGTGKSTMIAAMANFLNYDIYDLELTSVKNNMMLRKLLIGIESKSIIVIEDIDCSLNLTEKRKEKKDRKEKKKLEDEDEDDDNCKVTLSGLLNFIDGIWSALGGERIIVFTTNYVHKLDPALIRRGRMDKHIELSYCCYESFKVLAKNYLDVESHHLFGRIEGLLKETEMTPADVAENLMPKSMEEDNESCLKRLIEALEMVKEARSRKREEEEKKEEDEENRKYLSAEEEEVG
ncbi:hypothetical protein K1719_008772 [Acacia pycnantha]|nr:hypothetical protein K1719_008772 [Acacia pycnantha]